MWIYRPFNGFGTVYEVGYFHPLDNLFVSVNTYELESAAAARVNYLNGGDGREIRI